MTFRELYMSLADKKPELTAKQKFINRICDVTKKSESTVKSWVGGKSPDLLTRCIIEIELGINQEELFPNFKQNNHV